MSINEGFTSPIKMSTIGKRSVGAISSEVPLVHTMEKIGFYLGHCGGLWVAPDLEHEGRKNEG